MAQYHFEASIVSRSKGGSTIAKAAYNSRDPLTDWRTGEIKDYSKDHGPVEWTGIFAPKDAPEWMRNREELWNRLEAKEDENNRWASAQPSRAWIIGIPSEFDTAEKRQRFVIDYGRELARMGWVVDMAIHPPDHDQRNYHLHAQLPLREVGPDGFGKRIRLADKELRMTRESELEAQKKRFCHLAARHLERYGHREEAARFRVAYMTLEKQREEALKRGDHAHAKTLDREPTIHLGPAAWAMEKNGIRTRKGDQNREIKERNRERAAQKNWGRENTTDLQDALTPKHERGPNLRGDVEHVYFALNNAKTADDFVKDIEERGLHVTRVTAEDARRSETNHWAANRSGKHQPILQKDEYVILNDQGHAFRLNERTTGRTPQEIKTFLRPLAKEPIPDFFCKWNQLHEKRQAAKDMRPYGADQQVKRTVRRVSREAGNGLVRGTDKAASLVGGAGKAIGLITNTLESLLAPSLTPEQKQDARIAEDQRRAEAVMAARRNRDGDRDR